MDKIAHLLIGLLAGLTVTEIATPHYGIEKARLMGIGTAVIVGFGKELYDSASGKGTAEVSDALATIGGGLIAYKIEIEF